ncbi:hypothetical protein [Caudoviricetes sp.]|nr:hypothetical protein [Caudoviricetes sp.]
MFAGFVQALCLASVSDSVTIQAIPRYPITSRQEWVDYVFEEWYTLKIKALYFAVLDIVFLSRDEVKKAILDGNQKFGMKFEPWKIDWVVNRREEGRDTFTYNSGKDFTRYLLKYGKAN